MDALSGATADRAVTRGQDAELRQAAASLRFEIVQMNCSAGSGHLGGALLAVDGGFIA